MVMAGLDGASGVRKTFGLGVHVGVSVGGRVAVDVGV
jgi:hypothetical protein